MFDFSKLNNANSLPEQVDLLTQAVNEILNQEHNGTIVSVDGKTQNRIEFIGGQPQTQIDNVLNYCDDLDLTKAPLDLVDKKQDIDTFNIKEDIPEIIDEKTFYDYFYTKRADTNRYYTIEVGKGWIADGKPSHENIIDAIGGYPLSDMASDDYKCIMDIHIPHSYSGDFKIEISLRSLLSQHYYTCFITGHNDAHIIRYPWTNSSYKLVGSTNISDLRDQNGTPQYSVDGKTWKNFGGGATLNKTLVKQYDKEEKVYNAKKINFEGEIRQSDFNKLTRLNNKLLKLILSFDLQSTYLTNYEHFEIPFEPMIYDGHWENYSLSPSFNPSAHVSITKPICNMNIVLQWYANSRILNFVINYTNSDYPSENKDNLYMKNIKLYKVELS